MSISKKDAIILFTPCKNISEIQEVIKSNSLMWKSTITMLDICYLDAVKTKTSKHFGTMVYDNDNCYILKFDIYPNKNVNIVL